MSMLQQIQKLFGYDDWANREVLKSLQKSDGQPERAVQLLGHILGAEQVWLDRLRSQPITSAIWSKWNLTECQAKIASLNADWKSYLSSMDDAALSSSISYTNSKGEPFSTRVEDILLHVAMHSAYHRGQIATQVRQTGLTPVVTDFIHAVRQGVVE